MNEYLENVSINILSGVIGGCVVILFTDIEKFNSWAISLTIISSLIISYSQYSRKKREETNTISNKETEK